MKQNQSTAQLAYSIVQAAQAAGIGRTKLYEELSAGRLRAHKLGRRTVLARPGHKTQTTPRRASPEVALFSKVLNWLRGQDLNL